MAADKKEHPYAGENPFDPETNGQAHDAWNFLKSTVDKDVKAGIDVMKSKPAGTKTVLSDKK